jgi:ATP-dependent Clp protease ATP-binding subunit ClpC
LTGALEAKEVLAKEGFDPTYGARPLRRGAADDRRPAGGADADVHLARPMEGDIIKAVVKDGDIVFEKGEKTEEEDATPPPTEEPAAVS